MNAIYRSQRLDEEDLDRKLMDAWRGKISSLAEASDELAVITDAASDCCYIYSGRLASLLGLSDSASYEAVVGSSDEDAVYELMHPEDLADKRLLEYEYFKFVNYMPDEEKRTYKATCRIRMRGRDGRYVIVDNSTRVLQPSPEGKIWLILCRYGISPCQEPGNGISPAIVNTATGDVRQLELAARRDNILTPREKDVLRLIRTGKASKQIADILGISLNTVNRHRQNIIGKLSVSNSVEAAMAATDMKLI